MILNHGGTKYGTHVFVNPAEKDWRTHKKATLGKRIYNSGIQGAFGFENPQAIYKWLSGKSLPSIDNFIILSRLLHTSIEDILVIDGDISYYVGNFISYVIKASGRMRTAAYTEDVASDHRRR